MLSHHYLVPRTGDSFCRISRIDYEAGMPDNLFKIVGRVVRDDDNRIRLTEGLRVDGDRFHTKVILACRSEATLSLLLFELYAVADI